MWLMLQLSKRESKHLIIVSIKIQKLLQFQILFFYKYTYLKQNAYLKQKM